MPATLHRRPACQGGGGGRFTLDNVLITGMVSPAVRETVKAVAELQAKDPDKKPVTLQRFAEQLQLDKSAASGGQRSPVSLAT